MRFSTSGFLHESVSPKPLIIPLGPFQIFLKICWDIRSSRCTTGVNDTGGKWKKILNQKSFHYFFWTPLGSRVSIKIKFSFTFTLSCQQSDIVPIVCHRYQQHQQNWWQDLLPVANLPPVSLTPVVDLDLRMSPWISEKFEMTLALFSGAWGKMIHEKSEANNLVTLSL